MVPCNPGGHPDLFLFVFRCWVYKQGFLTETPQVSLSRHPNCPKCSTLLQLKT